MANFIDPEDYFKQTHPGKQVWHCANKRCSNKLDSEGHDVYEDYCSQECEREADDDARDSSIQSMIDRYLDK